MHRQKSKNDSAWFYILPIHPARLCSVSTVCLATSRDDKAERSHCTQPLFAKKLFQHSKTNNSTNCNCFYTQLRMKTFTTDRLTEWYWSFHLTGSKKVIYLPKYQTIPLIFQTKLEFCLGWKNPPVLTLKLSRVDFLSTFCLVSHSQLHTFTPGSSPLLPQWLHWSNMESKALL